MKTIRHLFCATLGRLFPRVVTIDNEAPFACDIVAIIDNENPTIMRLPYGHFPKNGFMQIMDKKAALRIQQMHEGKTVWDWAKRTLANGFSALFGQAAPVVIGHPRHTASAPSYGKITRVEVLDNECRLHTDLKPEGLALVSGATRRFGSFSPRFRAKIQGTNAHPFAIEHVCLTNRPAIPGSDIVTLDNDEGEFDEKGEAVLDNAEGESEDGMCAVPVEPLRSVREKLGLEPEATMEQVDAALKQHGAMIDDHKAAATKHAADHAALKQQFEAEQAKTKTLDNELTVSKNATTALRRTLVDKTLRALQQSGRVKASDFTSTLERLATLDNEAALATELDKLAALPGAPVVSRMSGASVGARIGTLDNERNASARATERAMEAVKTEQKRLEAGGLPSDQAFTRAYATVMN